jgi:hypothetical protein
MGFLVDHSTQASDPRRFRNSGSHLPVSEFVSAILAGIFPHSIQFDRNQIKFCVFFSWQLLKLSAGRETGFFSLQSFGRDMRRSTR